jgi:hypothetical protein
MLSRQTLNLLFCCALAWPWPNPAAAQQTLPAQGAGGNGMAITIDDLAGPNGPGPARSKGNHWKVEPGYGWWGPDDGFGDGFLY